MKGFKAVFKREMYGFFASPVFYVVGTIFLILCGYFFYTSVAYFSLISFQAAQNPNIGVQVNLNEMVIRPFLNDVSIILLLITPLLTMRLLAEEKKNGTIELLLTYPIREWAVLMGKAMATLAVIGGLLVSTGIYMVLLSWVGNPEWGAVFSGYLGLLLLACGFVSLGLFVSALTENQIVAGISGFGVLLMFWIIGWIGSVSGPGVGPLVRYLSLLEHMESFSQGVLDSRDVIFYLTFSVFFFFLTLRYLDSQRIRG
jgi:ABC-2 type transport system permease protein